MNYIKENKEAWEEAFNHRQEGWGEDVVTNLQNASDCYIHPRIKEEFDKLNLKNKKVAQFCCNNGRELLSIAKHYGTQGTGFDIAENLIAQGKQHALELQLPCEFITENILNIGTEYNESFDIIIFTIGAITWFEDLTSLFHVVSRCLKSNGIMIIHDFHPVMNMLPLPDEECYQKDTPFLLEHKYFTKQPWIEQNGMGYISGEYKSKTFTSFSHPVSKIINSAIQSDMNIECFDEFDYDVGLSDVYDGKGLPLSILLVSKKRT